MGRGCGAGTEGGLVTCSGRGVRAAAWQPRAPEQVGSLGKLFKLARNDDMHPPPNPSPGSRSELVLLPYVIHEYASAVLLPHVHVRPPRGYAADHAVEDMLAALLADASLPEQLSNATHLQQRECATMLAVLSPDDSRWAMAFCLILMITYYPDACLCL